MKPIHYTLSVLLLASASLWAENNEGYKFETVVNQKVTPVKRPGFYRYMLVLCHNFFCRGRTVASGQG